MSSARGPEAHRFETALALFEFSLSMMRQRLRRKHPAAPEAEIEERLMAWVQDRPGAPDGDCPGRVRPWPRA